LNIQHPRPTVATPNDLDAFWMPFTANRAFKARPRMLAGAKDMHYFTADGRSILDGAAGMWCSNAGHNRDPIVDAIQKQAATLDYAPPFQFGHPKAFELASRIAALAPKGLEHVFFCNSGSEAVDTALKVALAYHNGRGEAGRTRLIGRERGYHGVGFGGISVGGMVNNRKMFGTLLTGVDHLPTTYDREKQAFTKGEPEYGAHFADELERIVGIHGPGTIAARRMEDDLSAEEKKRRLKAVESLQERIATEINAGLLHTTQQVLVEGRERGKWRGRSRNDKLVFSEDPRELQGQMANTAKCMVSWDP